MDEQNTAPPQTTTNTVDDDIVAFLRNQLEVEREKHEELSLDLRRMKNAVSDLNSQLKRQAGEAATTKYRLETIIMDALGFILNENAREAELVLRSAFGPRELSYAYDRNSDFIAAKKREQELKEQNERLAKTIKNLSLKAIEGEV